jgi:hypothetical protein
MRASPRNFGFKRVFFEVAVSGVRVFSLVLGRPSTNAKLQWPSTRVPGAAAAWMAFLLGRFGVPVVWWIVDGRTRRHSGMWLGVRAAAWAEERES